MSRLSHILPLVLTINISNKYSKVKVADHVKISKYKIIFAKVYIPNGSEEVFVIRNAEFFLTVDFNNEEIVATFYEK